MREGQGFDLTRLCSDAVVQTAYRLFVVIGGVVPILSCEPIPDPLHFFLIFLMIFRIQKRILGMEYGGQSTVTLTCECVCIRLYMCVYGNT